MSNVLSTWGTILENTHLSPILRSAKWITHYLIEGSSTSFPHRMKCCTNVVSLSSLRHLDHLEFFSIRCLSLVWWVGSPLSSCFFLGKGTFDTMVTEILMIDIAPCKDNGEPEHDQDEEEIYKMLSLIRVLLVLVGHFSQPVGASACCFSCSDLDCMKTEFPNPSRGILILRETLFVRPRGDIFRSSWVGYTFFLYRKTFKKKRVRSYLTNEWFIDRLMCNLRVSSRLTYLVSYNQNRLNFKLFMNFVGWLCRILMWKVILDWDSLEEFWLSKKHNW